MSPQPSSKDFRKVLLIDDDDSLRRVTEYSLHSAGFKVLSAVDGKQGLTSFRKDKPHVVITDIQMPDLSGSEVLKQIKEESPETLVIVITAYSSVEKAVAAMKKGAYDYLAKPFSRDELVMVVEKAFSFLELQRENMALREELAHKVDFSHIVGTSYGLQHVFDTVRKVALSDASVLITGESGTGKELIARALHEGSYRSQKPFIAINCAAIPANLLESELFGHARGSFTGAINEREGKFLQANGGTLFLDEIGEMPMELQPKLLRVLQEMEVEPVGGKPHSIDVRIVAATNQDIENAIEDGMFREDLFYRLSVIPIELPPLRRRVEDIPLLVKHFLDRFNKEEAIKISDDAMEVMMAYHWPGNIRELQNTVERLLVLAQSDCIESQDLPEKIHKAVLLKKNQVIELPPDGYPLEEIEKEAIIQALEKNGWNQTKAAAFLQMPRHALIYRLGKFNITTP